jgi:hypothetical protein
MRPNTSATGVIIINDLKILNLWLTLRMGCCGTDDIITSLSLKKEPEMIPYSLDWYRSVPAEPVVGEVTDFTPVGHTCAFSYKHANINRL